MPSDGRKYVTVPRQLSDEDKTYIKLLGDGERKSPAFKTAYPDHPAVKRYFKAVADGKDQDYINRQSLLINQAAKTKLQAQYMQKAIATYQDKMEEFSILSLETATELVQTARSEKVRADLAIEGIRHKIGTPVQKIAVKEDKVVTLQWAKPTQEKDEDEIIEGEVVESQT
jgi:hypothetical protein